MERHEDEQINTEKEAPQTAPKESAEKTNGLKPRRMDKRLWVFTGIFVLVSFAIGCIVWFMPAKINEVVEDFDIGRRSAQFEQVPEFLKKADNPDPHMARSYAREAAGGKGKRHKGEEGQMGMRDASKKPSHNRYAIRGPANQAAVLGIMQQKKPYGFINDPNAVYAPGHNTEAYNAVNENPFLQVSDSPLSTFSIDVDTASYANVRRYLREDTRPPKDAVRIEELVNYFAYNYPPPEGSDPFSVNLETAPCPWNADHTLARIGLKGRTISEATRPSANLVFLIDVSGSMQPYNKLPLIKRAMTLLVEKLDARDTVAMVVYAGASGVVLERTRGSKKVHIRQSLEQLDAGGSTNGGAGIELAYRIAKEGFIKGGVNRVILATDGDFNVGTTDNGSLVRLIKEKAKSGVYLTVLGVGMGNLKDARLEQLADKGNGHFAYIDSLSEARKVLVDEMGSTLVTIAKDVKLQVEFNPANVGSYRLIGYENRILAARDFNDDKKDAGEIGAGHTVTALYELAPPSKSMSPEVDPLKYRRTSETAAASTSGELFTVKLRYKPPTESKSLLMTFVAPATAAETRPASSEFSLAAAAAGFGMLLRNSPHKGSASFSSILALAGKSLAGDKYGYRKELISLIEKAEQLIEPQSARALCTSDRCK